MKRLLFVDYMGSVYYHYHAKEKHVEYNFIKNLREIIAAYKVDKVFILCEGGGSSYRKALHPGYKATRKANREKKSPEEKKEFSRFLETTNKLLGMLSMLGVAVNESRGAEADDVAAYICSYLPSEEYQILLLTEDSDWNQLLHRPNTVWGSYKEMIKEPLTKARWKNYTAFTEAKGLSPDTWFVKKMLIGDTSDDIPGLNGVGETLALRIVEQYPTLAEIVANKGTMEIQRMTGKARESLLNCEETFKLGYQLMNLRWPEEKWLAILGEQEARLLRERVEQHLSRINNVDKAGFLELCYAKGWLVFVDEIDEWLRPFYGN